MYSRFERNSMPAPPLPSHIPEKTGQLLRHLLLSEKAAHARQEGRWLFSQNETSSLQKQVVRVSESVSQCAAVSVCGCVSIMWRGHCVRACAHEQASCVLCAQKHGWPRAAVSEHRQSCACVSCAPNNLSSLTCLWWCACRSVGSAPVCRQSMARSSRRFSSCRCAV